MREFKGSDKKYCILKRTTNNGKNVEWFLGQHQSDSVYTYTHINDLPKPAVVTTTVAPSLPTITPGPPLVTPTTLAQTTNAVNPAEIFETVPTSWEDL